MPATSRRFRIATVDDMEAMLDALREHEGFALMGDIGCLVAMGVCPAPLFGAFEREAYRLFQMVKGGGPWPWPGSHYEQPAIFARAQDIIGSELTAIASEGKTLGG